MPRVVHIMKAANAFVDWLLSGRVDGGQCPKCHRDTMEIEEFEYNCTACGYGDTFPEVPDWL